MKPAVLMLTNVYDFSADLVALRLKENGVPFLRINKEHVLASGLSTPPSSPYGFGSRFFLEIHLPAL